MKALAAVAVLVVLALAASACAGGHPATSSSTGTKTDAIMLHESGNNALPKSLQAFINRLIAKPTDGKIDEIDVYGPGSRTALVKASSGDIVTESAAEQTMHFYLIVSRGHFVCDSCTGPPGSKPPHGTIETFVWSPQEGGTDGGVSSSLPPAMSRLHRLATITLS